MSSFKSTSNEIVWFSGNISTVWQTHDKTRNLFSNTSRDWGTQRKRQHKKYIIRAAKQSIDTYKEC